MKVVSAELKNKYSTRRARFSNFLDRLVVKYFRKKSRQRPPVDPPSRSKHQIPLFLTLLPIDIRLIIYEFVIGKEDYNLRRIQKIPIWSYGGFYHPRPPCVCGYNSDPAHVKSVHPLYRNCPGYPEPSADAFSHVKLEYWREKPTRWALLLTSRQIYDEVLELFYRSSNLTLDRPQILLDLSERYLSKRSFMAIRHMDVVWEHCFYRYREHSCISDLVPPRFWQAFWELVANEMKLSSLNLCIIVCSFPTSTTVETTWLQPLLDVRNLTSFELELKPASESFAQPEILKAMRRLEEDLVRQMIQIRNGASTESISARKNTRPRS